MKLVYGFIVILVVIIYLDQNEHLLDPYYQYFYGDSGTSEESAFSELRDELKEDYYTNPTYHDGDIPEDFSEYHVMFPDLMDIEFGEMVYEGFEHRTMDYILRVDTPDGRVEYDVLVAYNYQDVPGEHQTHITFVTAEEI